MMSAGCENKAIDRVRKIEIPPTRGMNPQCDFLNDGLSTRSTIIAIRLNVKMKINDNKKITINSINIMNQDLINHVISRYVD
jgi:hypothetical protein